MSFDLCPVSAMCTDTLSVITICRVTDVAGEEKTRLEEKQRGARRERKKRRDEWTPV